MNSNYNIFICYRGDNDPHKDGKYIGLDVYSELQKIDGFDCFFAPKHNKSNDDFKHINGILKTVKVALLILTDGFFDRCYENDDIVKIELDEILKRDIAIIPIFVNNYNIQADREKINKLFESEELIDKFYHKAGYHYTGIYDFKGDEIASSIKEIFACVENNLKVSELDETSILSKIGHIEDSSSVTVAQDKLIKIIKEKLYSEPNINMEKLRSDTEHCIKLICDKIAHFSVLSSLWDDKLSKILKKNQTDALNQLQALIKSKTENMDKVAKYAGEIIKGNDGILTFSQSQYVIDFLCSTTIPVDKRLSSTVFICEGRSKCKEPFDDAIEIHNKLRQKLYPSRYKQQIIITDCSVYQLICEHKITKIVFGACAVELNQGILTGFVNAAGTEVILMLAEKFNIPVYIVSDSEKPQNSFECRELQLSIKGIKSYLAKRSVVENDIDAVDYVRISRTPNMVFVSENGQDITKIADYFWNDICKDKRKALTENDKTFIKICEKSEFDFETDLITDLKNNQCNVPGILISDGKKKSLKMERVKGIRLFELFVILDELAREGLKNAIEIKAKLLDRCNKNQEKIIDIITEWNSGNRNNLEPYPISKIEDMLVNLYYSIVAYYPDERFTLNENTLRLETRNLYNKFCQKATVPFRDSTIKNMALKIDELDEIDNIVNEELKERMKEKIKNFISHDNFDKYDIVDFDFSSCKNLTMRYDDFIGLNMHESTYNAAIENYILDKFIGNEDFAISLFVRYLRFAGRKRMYRLMNPSFHNIRFRYDNEKFYFKKFIYIVDKIMPSFREEYKTIYKLFKKLSELPNTNPKFDMIKHLYNFHAEPWLGLWKPK